MRRPLASLLSLLSVLAAASSAAAQNISTFAGGGPDNLPALASSIPTPRGVAVDPAGNIFIATNDGNRVFRVDAASGVMTVAAGTGAGAFGGDGGPAVLAGVNSPNGLDVDSSGFLYVADSASNRIRRVDLATGIITTIAGSAFAGSSGDGGPATGARLSFPHSVALDGTGGLLIADMQNHKIRRVNLATGIISTVAGIGLSGFSGDGGPATAARLNLPIDVAVDTAGNMYIAEAGNRRIRRVDAVTGVITTLAGTGVSGSSGDGGPATAATFVNPLGVGVEGASRLFVADQNANRVRAIDLSTGIISTFAGNGVPAFGGDGGPAAAANIFQPTSVVVDGFNRLVITDQNNLRVRRVDLATGIITTVAGNGQSRLSGDGFLATSASLNSPAGVVLDAGGNVFVLDQSNHRVRRVDQATGIITTVAGSSAGFAGDGGAATAARLSTPFGLALDSAGNIFIADTNNRRIRRVDASTGVISTYAGTGGSGFTGDGGPATSATFGSPVGVAIDAAGNLFIADLGNFRIRKVSSATGVISTVAGNGAAGFSGDGGAATGASLNNAYGISVDAGGNLFIGDTSNNRVRRVDAATGVITTVAGSAIQGFAGDGGLATAARLNSPRGIALDAGGNLLIADMFNNRIRRVDKLTGVMTTVAGNGTLAFSGDGGPATSAALATPLGVAGGSGGAFFIADANNNRVRRVAPANVPPIANAGPDQTVEATTPAGATVALDGSGSSDADGHGLTYEWRNAASTVVGSSAAINLNVALGSHTFTLHVDDGHGGTASDQIVVTVRDTTPPSIALTPLPSPFALNQVVVAHYSCTDGVSLPVSCVGTAADGAPIDTTTAGPHVFVVTASDAAGNTAIVEHPYFVNKGQPIVSWPAPAAITFGVALGALQLNASADVAGTVVYTPPAGTVLSVGNAQNLSVAFTPNDLANYLTASASVVIDVLKADQIIGFGALANKNHGDPDFAVTASASSMLPVTFTIVDGPATVSGSTVHLTGSGVVTVRATQDGDASYNAAPAVDRSFTVLDVVTRTGFYAPVNPSSSYLNTVKGGSTVPLKFNVTVNGVEKTDVAGLAFSVSQVACGGGVEDAVDFVTTGGTSLRYDTSAQQFIQNWQTPKIANACYVVRMTTTADGGSLSAMFKMK